jgi:hypothetical protein
VRAPRHRAELKIVEPRWRQRDQLQSANIGSSHAMSAELTDYQPFIQRSSEAFSRMSAARLIDSGDVAKVVHEAATDGSDRLRYLVGNDTRGFIKARAALPDQEYVDFLRSHFRDAIGKS